MLHVLDYYHHRHVHHDILHVGDIDEDIEYVVLCHYFDGGDYY